MLEIIKRPLDPRDDRAESCDIGEVLRFVQAIAAPRAEGAGVDLVLDDAAAPRAFACSTGRLRQIAFQLAIDVIGRAQPGFRVTLGAEGAAERFFLYAECRADRPSTVAPTVYEEGTKTEVMRLVQRLVDKENGRVELEEDPATGWSRVVCHFIPRGPMHRGPGMFSNGDPATVIRRDNVHELKSRAS